MDAERARLKELHDKKVDWLQWGPYLSDRSWGTLREHYDQQPNFWQSLSHDMARSHAYRWGEDGIAGISDKDQFLCFGLSMWNGQDAILKERLYGLTNPEGNHGEDVKELYFHLLHSPTHSYMEYLYKYPQAAFPYEALQQENGRRGQGDLEYELLDTGVFDEGKYFDVRVRYAKADENDMLIQIMAKNQGDETAPLWLLPTIWFRNTWAWGYPNGPQGSVTAMPGMQALEHDDKQIEVIQTDHPRLGRYFLYGPQARELLFTNNETNQQRLHGQPNSSPYVKDGFHRYVVNKQDNAVNKDYVGTKAGLMYEWKEVGAGQSVSVTLRLSPQVSQKPFEGAEQILHERQEEARQFYAGLDMDKGEQFEEVGSLALSGLLWTKMWYYWDFEQWHAGDPINPRGKKLSELANSEWGHLKNADVISMPDKWEYPWYANWDLAFQAIALGLVDMEFAKKQLALMVADGYMHPNGQLPSFENDLNSANPPVIAWAVWQLYEREKSSQGEGDTDFLQRLFHRLVFNFSWWVNRKDVAGRNIFQGGFLGLDNIGVIDRNEAIPGGGHIDQADSTSWMAMYALAMVQISLELAQKQSSYQDIAVKFFDHFLRIVDASTHVGDDHINLWDEEDGFYYDVLHLSNGHSAQMKVRSLVGLLPIAATVVLDQAKLSQFPELARRIHETMVAYPRLLTDGHVASCDLPGASERRMLAMVNQERLEKILARMLDETEFLSPYGIRSLSKAHQGEGAYCFDLRGTRHCVDYQPGESVNLMFGGNSNWRGPIWMPLNYLLVWALRENHKYYGDNFRVPCPVGSKTMMTLNEVADELSKRLVSCFVMSAKGERPITADQELMSREDMREGIQFFEYYQADTGRGLGASHQTGWTALVANLIEEMGGR